VGVSENKELVRRFYEEVWDRGNVAAQPSSLARAIGTRPLTDGERLGRVTLELGRKKQGCTEADEPDHDQRGHRPRIGPVPCRDDGDENRAGDRGSERRAQVGDAARQP
jgi:hypothetical protein